MWLVYSIGAAIIWGLDYSVGESVLKNKVSPFTLLALQMGIGALCFFGLGFSSNLKGEVGLILSDRRLLWTTVAAIVSFNLGNLLIFLSIQAKNATVAGLVELCYPIFTILFTYLIFGENHLNPGVVLGGTLIMIGIGIISYTG